MPYLRAVGDTGPFPRHIWALGPLLQAIGFSINPLAIRRCRQVRTAISTHWSALQRFQGKALTSRLRRNALGGFCEPVNGDNLEAWREDFK